MKYVIVNSNAAAAAAIQKCIDLVLPWLSSSVAVSVVRAPLGQFLHSYHVEGSSAIVSPANSLSYMGGGFDKAILDELTGHANSHYKTLEAAIQQKALYHHNGYIVPGSVHIVDLAMAYRAANIDFHTTVAWQKRITTLIQAPTMVVPEPISRQAVFDCMWSVLVESRGVADTIILPALGAGYGGVDAHLVGQLMAGALGIFHMDLPPLARSVAILLFTGKDYRKLGLASDIAELEQYLTDKGRLVTFDSSEWPMAWDSLIDCLKNVK